MHGAWSKFVPIRSTVVQIEAVYDPEEEGKADILHDVCGNRLPPFIVMEKGESLIDWSKRNHSDVFQAVAVRPCPLPH
jgi:hypothetical protein